MNSAAQKTQNLEHNAQVFMDNMMKAGQLWQEVAAKLSANALNENNLFSNPDNFNLTEAFGKLATTISNDPDKFINANTQLVSSHFELWKNATAKMIDKQPKTPEQNAKKDRRFKDDAWSNNVWFDYILNAYKLNSEWLRNLVSSTSQNLDRQTKNKLNFFTNQFIDVVSPSNFLATNPEVLRATLDSNGENIVVGMRNLLNDINNSGDGKLRISMTDNKAFELGKNIATTKGKVVYRNDLIQLIQYVPKTDKVFSVPLLMIPAWINKYYVLDMSENNSFIKWAVEKGYNVFVVSWVNPDEELKDKSFEDYLKEGPLTALKVVEEITGSKKTAALGYCLGGTLLSIMLSYLTEIGESNRVASATYLTTLTDFAEAGDLSVFIDENQLATLENRMSSKGYLDAQDMAVTFNMLRSNDLIWSFVINNYLLGKNPFPFDLLYWNADSTRMPAKAHSYYLRQMYQNNLLSKPRGLSVLGVPIDLRNINLPTYMLSTIEDHIAPWKSTYSAANIFSGLTKFVLAESGHIAGVIHPPGKDKYGYFTNNRIAKTADDWLKAAEKHAGSWWDNWHEWQQQMCGEMVKASKTLGSAKYKPLEDAPGAYAKLKS